MERRPMSRSRDFSREESENGAYLRVYSELTWRWCWHGLRKDTAAMTGVRAFALENYLSKPWFGRLMDELGISSFSSIFIEEMPFPVYSTFYLVALKIKKTQIWKTQWSLLSQFIPTTSPRFPSLECWLDYRGNSPKIPGCSSGSWHILTIII